MENTSKKKGKKFLKFLLIAIVSLILIGFIGHLAWVSSGSNKWEKSLEKEGIVVHALKQPGKFVLQMKATKRIKSKLAAFVSVMQDVEAMCTDGCYEARVIKKEADSHLLSTFTRFDLPSPMKDREWVLENHFSQDPQTKEILYKIRAIPDIVPENDGYVRIKHFNNSWRFTSAGNGEVDVVWTADMDQGGYLVNLLFNLGSADAMRSSLLEIEKLVQKEKYQNAKFDFIEEVDEMKVAEN